MKKYSSVWRVNSAGEEGEMLRCIITRAYGVDLDLRRIPRFPATTSRIQLLHAKKVHYSQ